jgi:hypothetical protein
MSSGAGVRSGMGSLPVLDVVECSGEVEIPLVEIPLVGEVAILLGLAVRCKGAIGVFVDFDGVAKKASVRGVNETARGGGGGGGLRRT